MTERARRIGHNEALFREINEQIEHLNRDLAKISDEKMHIVCECGDLGCTQVIAVPIDEYERIRGDAAQFFVEPGHQMPDVETVVESRERFWVVRKDPGEPEAIARASDPRSN